VTDTALFAGGGVVVFLLLMGIIFVMRQHGDTSSSSVASKNDDVSARDRSQQAAENPKDPGILLKSGHDLAARAGASETPLKRMQLYKEAAEFFRRATELAPSLVVAWKALGQTLYILFRLGDCKDRAVLANANAAYEAAVRLELANASLWQYWGEDLYMAATYCKEEEKREELLALAKARYARAVTLAPALMEDWKAWGGSAATLDEVRAAVETLVAPKQQEGMHTVPAELGGGGGFVPETPGAQPAAGKPEGTMPWELEADMENPEKYFK